MKYLGAFVSFLAAFMVAGIVMHVALYERAGIFIWSLQDDPDTGKTGFARTTLALLTPIEPAGEVEATPANTAAPAEKAEAAPAPAVVSPKKDEISLFDGKELGKWKKTAFGGEGDVFVNEEGNLEFGFGAVITGVNWAEAPPALSNYELSLEAMKLNGNDFFIALTFPVKESHATFVVGGWGGGVVGISSVDDLNASENETMSIEGFEKDVWYKIRVQVTDDHLKAWIDDEKKVDLELKDRKISLLPGDIELSVPIGIAAYQSRAQYRNIVWKPLKAEK